MPPPSVAVSGHRAQMRPSRHDEGPINNNYTRIYSADLVRGGYAENNNNDDLSEIYRDPVSSDSDYDTIYSNKEDNNTLLPIGKIRSGQSINVIYHAFRTTVQMRNELSFHSFMNLILFYILMTWIY